jgi:hypothetical protein
MIRQATAWLTLIAFLAEVANLQALAPPVTASPAGHHSPYPSASPPPPAQQMDELTFQNRAAAVLEDVACNHEDNFATERNAEQRDRNENLIYFLVAKIALVKRGKDCGGARTRAQLTKDVDDVIANWQASYQVGTDPIPCPEALNLFPSNGAPMLPDKAGDYDVALRGLVWIAYNFQPVGAGVGTFGLSPATYKHLRDDLLIIDGTSGEPPRTEQYRYGVMECGHTEHSSGSPSARADSYNQLEDACEATGSDCNADWPAPSDDDAQEDGCFSSFWSALGCGLIGLLAFLLGAVYPPAAAVLIGMTIAEDPDVGIPLAVAPMLLPFPIGWAIAGGLAGVAVVANDKFQIPETENHILMIETSRFLTNNLMRRDYECTDVTIQGLTCSRDDYRGYTKRFDNSANRTAEWILRYLQDFLKRDFIEFNSRPYQRYAHTSIQNLYDLACAFGPCTGDNLRVKIAAKAVLDFLSAKITVSNNSIRRLVPFRRRAEYKAAPTFDWLNYHNEMDFSAQRFSLFEDQPVLPSDGAGCPGTAADAVCGALMIASRNELVATAVSQYRVPSMLWSIFHAERPDPNQAPQTACDHYLQRFHHAGAEAYYCAPGFLISAGGLKTKLAYYMQGKGDEDNDVGVAVPTSLMPTGWGTTVGQMIRFDGGANGNADNHPNMCVERNFACGMELKIPGNYITTTCGETDGNWRFIDTTCLPDVKGSFYVAAYLGPCAAGSAACADTGATNFGFLETADASPQLSFADFKHKVKALNGNRVFTADDVDQYMTVNAVTIRFRPGSASIEGQDPGRWPLASGDIVSASGDGCVILTNPARSITRIISMTDYNTPYIVEFNETGDWTRSYCSGHGAIETSLR